MRTLIVIAFLLLATTFAFAQDDMMEVDGLIMVPSEYDVDETTERLQTALTDAGLTVITTLDHDANAASVDLELAPTHLIIFGNPALGTQLMVENQAIGLDLPQKFLIYEDAEGTVYVAYNDPDYLRRRYGIETTDVLDTITGALGNFSGMVSATDAPMDDMSDDSSDDEGMMDEVDGLMMENGLITVESSHSFEDTLSGLQVLLEENGFRIPVIVDHANNAMNAEMEIRPTTLIIFGNPNVGTGLMQAQPTIAIDLPQKFLIWEGEDGSVNITYNDPAFIAQRHNLEGMDETISNIAGVLANAAQQAASAG